MRQKLREAKAAAEKDPRFQANVDALQTAVPADKNPTQITAKLGTEWIPVADFQQFVRELTGNQRAEVTKDEDGNWKVKVGRGGKRNTSVEGGQSMPRPRGYTGGPLLARWGTRRSNTYDLVETALSQGRPVVKDEIEKCLRRQPGGGRRRCQESRRSAEFSSWLWRDEEAPSG